jgi:hypothetical protein
MFQICPLGVNLCPFYRVTPIGSSPAKAADPNALADDVLLIAWLLLICF